jgi:hypothetical protein
MYLVPPHAIPDLRREDLISRVEASQVLAGKRSALIDLAQQIHGKGSGAAEAAQKILSDITKDREPLERATKAAERIARYPEALAPLPGEARGFFKAQSPERTAALSQVETFVRALADYGMTAQVERKRIAQEYQAHQDRLRVGIPLPSPRLQAALDSEAQDRVKQLAEPGLQRELTNMELVLRLRLTPADRKAISNGQTSDLSRSLGIKPEAAQQLAKLAVQVKQGREEIRGQERELTRVRGPGRER